jgi:hypothetical protein
MDAGDTLLREALGGILYCKFSKLQIYPVRTEGGYLKRAKPEAIAVIWLNVIQIRGGKGLCACSPNKELNCRALL